MIPHTLDEAVEQILSEMTETQKRDFAAEPYARCASRFHFFGGMAMRNDWGLWHGETAISAFLRVHRIWHGDDASQTIYQAVHRRLHDLPIGDEWLAEQAAHYEAFWLRSGLTWDQKPIPGFKSRSTHWFKMTEGGGTEEIDGP